MARGVGQSAASGVGLIDGREMAAQRDAEVGARFDRKEAQISPLFRCVKGL